MPSTLFHLPDGQVLSPGQQFSLHVTLQPAQNGNPAVQDTLTFPSNWLELATPDDLTRFGITSETVADPAPVPLTQAQLIEYAADKRRDLAGGSTTVDIGSGGTSHLIPTWVDLESRSSILGLVVASQMVPTLTTVWKCADGSYCTLNAAEMLALSMGMLTYIENCFAVEASADDKINNEIITTTDGVDVLFASLVGAPQQ